MNIKCICTWHEPGEKYPTSLTFLPVPKPSANKFYIDITSDCLVTTTHPVWWT